MGGKVVEIFAGEADAAKLLLVDLSLSTLSFYLFAIFVIACCISAVFCRIIFRLEVGGALCHLTASLVRR